MSYNFSIYRDLELSTFPCRGKKPHVAWMKYRESLPTQDQVEAWDKTQHNIAIATGKLSGVVVVDIDSDAIPLEDYPLTWTVKTSKGYHLYYRYPEGSEVGNKARLNGQEIDIRGEGGYVIAPPSRHPDGHVYHWVEGKSPEDIPLAELPNLKIEKKKPTLLDQFRVLPEPTETGQYESYIQKGIDNEIEELLNTGEGGRNHQLNKTTFALAQFIPHGVSENYLKERLRAAAYTIGLNVVETEKTIESGLKAGRTKPRALPEKQAPVEAPAQPIHQDKKEKSTEEIPGYLIEGAPNMLGSFIRWTLETSLYPQPTLALAAAIPAIGMIMGHRVQSESGFRTNFYTLGIAESGSGKEHARKCMAKLYQASGLDDHMVGDPASATAVINSVKRANGQALMRIDEFGRFLDAMRGGNSASHTAGITTNMMHLYNSASEKFTGIEYADNMANGGRSDIDQPCLNIYATTVPHRYYDSLTNDEAYDGFLSRWLVFETNRFDVDPHLAREKLTLPPEDLLDATLEWKAHSKYNGKAASTLIEPRTIEYTAEARKAWFGYIRDKRTQMTKTNDPVTRAFVNRAAEHCAKLALVAHRGATIDSATLDWAKELTEHLTETTVVNIHAHVARNEYEKMANEIKAYVKGRGETSRSEVANRFRHLDRRRRNDILETLVESGELVESKKRVEGADRTTTLFH